MTEDEALAVLDAWWQGSRMARPRRDRRGQVGSGDDRARASPRLADARRRAGATRPCRPAPTPSAFYRPIGDFQGADYRRNAFAAGTAEEVAALWAVAGLAAGTRVLDVGCGDAPSPAGAGRPRRDRRRRGGRVAGAGRGRPGRGAGRGRRRQVLVGDARALAGALGARARDLRRRLVAVPGWARDLAGVRPRCRRRAGGRRPARRAWWLCTFSPRCSPHATSRPGTRSTRSTSSTTRSARSTDPTMRVAGSTCGPRATPCRDAVRLLVDVGLGSTTSAGSNPARTAVARAGEVGARRPRTAGARDPPLRRCRPILPARDEPPARTARWLVSCRGSVAAHRCAGDGARDLRGRGVVSRRPSPSRPAPRAAALRRSGGTGWGRDARPHRHRNRTNTPCSTAVLPRQPTSAERGRPPPHRRGRTAGPRGNRCTVHARCCRTVRPM